MMTKEELLANRRIIKKYSGVYFLFKGEEIIYIGKTVDLYQRITSHRVKEFDSYYLIPMDDRLEMDRLEEAYIKLYQPIYNVIKNPNVGASGERLYDVVAKLRSPDGGFINAVEPHRIVANVAIPSEYSWVKMGRNLFIRFGSQLVYHVILTKHRNVMYCWEGLMFTLQDGEHKGRLTKAKYRYSKTT